MVGWAVELLEYFLDGPQVGNSPLFDGGIILVFEIAKLDEKINFLGVHQFHAFGQFVKRVAVEARADGIGVGIMAVGNYAEACGTRPEAGAGLRTAGQRRCGQSGKRGGGGFQENPPGDYPALIA
jgi:hypothetical protein